MIRCSRPNKKLWLWTASALLLVFGFGCNGLRDNQSNSKEDTSASNGEQSSAASVSQDDGVIEQPQNVAGAFGLYMECAAVTRNSSDTVTRVGCVFRDNNGKKYNKDIAISAAKVYAEGVENPIDGAIEAAPENSAYDFVVRIDGSKVAISVEAAVLVDGQSRSLSAPVYATLLKAIADMTLYVTPQGKDTTKCAKDSPCGNLASAIAVLPERFDHAVEINLAEGTYQENVKIHDFVFGPGGQLTIRGRNSDFTADATVVIAGADNSNHVLDIRNLAGTFKLRNIELKHNSLGSGSGLVISNCSNVLLESMKVTGSYNGITFGNGTRATLMSSIESAGHLGYGMLLNSDSRVFLEGNNSTKVHQNGTGGIFVERSHIEIISGAQLEALANTGNGVRLLNGSSLTGWMVGSTLIKIASQSTHGLVVEWGSTAAMLGHKVASETNLGRLEVDSSAAAAISVSENSMMKFNALNMKIAVNAAAANSVVFDTNSSLIVYHPLNCAVGVSNANACLGNVFFGQFSGATLYKSSAPSGRLYYDATGNGSTSSFQVFTMQ